jgi:hypothetical protein
MEGEPRIYHIDELRRYEPDPSWKPDMDFSSRMGMKCLRNEETAAMIVIDEANNLIRTYAHVIALYEEWVWRNVDEARPLEAQLDFFRDCFAMYLHLRPDELDYTDCSINRIDEVLEQMASNGLELDWELIAPFSMYVAGYIWRKVGGRVEFTRGERSGPEVVGADGRRVNVWHPIYKHFFDESFTGFLSFVVRTMVSGDDLPFEGTGDSDLGWTAWEA